MSSALSRLRRSKEYRLKSSLARTKLNGSRGFHATLFEFIPNINYKYKRDINDVAAHNLRNPGITFLMGTGALRSYKQTPRSEPVDASRQDSAGLKRTQRMESAPHLYVWRAVDLTLSQIVLHTSTQHLIIAEKYNTILILH